MYGLRYYDILLWSRVGHPCFETVGYFYTVHNVEAFPNVYVEQVLGNVEWVSVSFNSEGAMEIKQATVEKYGPPHSSWVEHKQNRMGASFDDQVMMWKGLNVQVVFHSIGSKVDEGSLTAFTSAYEKQSNKNHESGKESIKGIL